MSFHFSSMKLSFFVFLISKHKSRRLCEDINVTISFVNIQLLNLLH